MAVDSAAKRGSALSAGRPWTPAFPDGTATLADRMQAAFCYPVEGVIPPPAPVAGGWVSGGSSGWMEGHGRTLDQYLREQENLDAKRRYAMLDADEEDFLALLPFIVDEL